MKKVIHKSDTRGAFTNNWLNTRYSFSFADYFDRDRMNFGALRVLNDDIIQPGQGFGKHPHDNMEIITIPLKGALSHVDSMGHHQLIHAGEVQVMTAGTGIFHSEFNPGNSDELGLLQIWIYPHSKNIQPSYDQKAFETSESVNKWQLLVSGDHSNNSVLHINQHAKISRLHLEKGNSTFYVPDKNSYGCYIFIVEGELEIADETLQKRDSIGILGIEKFNLKALQDSFLINIEVPDR